MPSAQQSEGDADALPGRILASALPYAQLNWEALKQIAIAECGCSLSIQGKKYAPSKNNQRADWLLIVDAQFEDGSLEQDAELLFTEMLSAIGLSRAQVFITSVLDYSETKTDALNDQSLLNGLGYLTRQIELLNPKIILVLGAVAAKRLLQTDASVAELRGINKSFSLGASCIPTVVTYHPAYLLQSALDKRSAWLDLQRAIQTFSQKNH
ncbi:MAG: uracil-DNA glycosylase [Methylococcaceae bacterium]|nr:uracil-DNA glycosylase [Methylococcaceae bacterium]